MKGKKSLMKISSAIITGGAGFIGSHLIDALLNDGCSKILVIDDLSTGKKRNIEKHIKSGNVELINKKVEDVEDIKGEIKGYDICFHLAAGVGVQYIMENVSSSLLTNIEATHKMIEACSENQIPLLLTSTSEVYGVSTDEVWNEETRSLIGPPTKLRWSYATSKLIDEFLALSEYESGNLKPIIVRLFNIIGPRQVGEFGMVVPKFIAQAQKGEALVVHGDGEQSRSFTWVGDVVSSFLKLAEAEVYGEIFNIGHPEEVTINELAKLIVEVNDSDSKIKKISHKEIYGEAFDDPRRRTPDISKIEKAINYKPSMTLEEMIREISTYMKS